MIVTANTSAPTGHSNPFRPGKDFALFFAVSNYDQWDDLKNPISEAEAIAKDLRDLYGFQTEVVRDPTKAEIQTKIDEYRKKAYADDAQLFIFFTGHGEYIETTKEGFFVPKDAKRNDPSQDSYLPYLRLQRWVETLPCRHILLAIDACFSGTFNDDIALKGDPGKRPGQSDWREQYIRQSLQYRSRIFMASGAKVRTPDKSAFAEQFLTALRSFGGDDGLVNTTELWSYVQRASPKPCAIRFGDHEAGGDFLFVMKNEGDSMETLKSTDTLTNTRFIPYDGALAYGCEMGLNDGIGQRDWLHNKGGYIEMAYPGNLSWGAVFITFGSPYPDADLSQRKCMDFSKYDSVYIEMRSEKDKEAVMVGLKDCKGLNDGKETKMVQTLTTNWKTYSFALSKFVTCNLRELHVPIEFVFDNKAATVYCRNVQFK